jgi:RhoGAP domain
MLPCDSTVFSPVRYGKPFSCSWVSTDPLLASTSRGIFRIPGSHATVNALYNHYASQDEDGESVNGTVRYPTLPEHIKYDVHDVASAFKKFLAGLPAGILGKAWLFNAFASIHYQLDADPERTKTKQSKVRARMIALAIASIVPQSQREFICAVMGLLSMIGRAAETTPREDEHGRPLPTSDLMGYGPLGIIFGPLLIGQLLEYHDSYPGRALALSPPSPPKLPRGRHKKNKSIDDTVTFQNGIDKIRIANCIAEMLITHWREVVRHMKNLGALKSTRGHCGLNPTPFLRPSASESFVLRSPPDWEFGGASTRRIDSTASPSPSPRK